MNNRKKLFVVTFAICSVVWPLSSANLAAVNATNAGSFLFPRFGTGDRYGASVSTNSLSDGIWAIVSWSSRVRLKVNIPETEI